MLKLSIILGTLFAANVYAGCCVTPDGVCCLTGCSQYCTHKVPEKDLTKLLSSIKEGTRPALASSVKSN